MLSTHLVALTYDLQSYTKTHTCILSVLWNVFVWFGSSHLFNWYCEQKEWIVSSCVSAILNQSWYNPPSVLASTLWCRYNVRIVNCVVLFWFVWRCIYLFLCGSSLYKLFYHKYYPRNKKKMTPISKYRKLKLIEFVKWTQRQLATLNTVFEYFFSSVCTKWFWWKERY